MEASVEDKKKIILVHYTEIENFILQVLLKNGVDESVAKHVAQGLVQASLRGVDSHGIRLFPHYVRAMKAGRINSKPNFQFDQTSPSTGILDADDTFGHAAGMEAVSKAIELAKSAGSANISVKKSTHFGAAAFYALEIAKHDMIGMSFTHADSLMLSSNGNRPYFGTNPICIAVPCEGEEPFCLDMATTTISFNAVLQHREDKKDVPVGTCADSEGNPTIDSAKASFLQPIGQYKGFGLGMMVEILCGVLSGMPFGRDIVSMYKHPIEQKRNLGHFFSAMRIDCFQDVKYFKKRMRIMMDEIRNEPRKNSDIPVMVPNDPEKKALARRSKEGIPVKAADWEAFLKLSQQYKVELKGI